MLNPSGIDKNNVPKKQSQKDLYFLRTILSSFGPYSVYLCNAPAPVAYFFFFLSIPMYIPPWGSLLLHLYFVINQLPDPLAKQKLPLVCPQASPDITKRSRCVRRTQTMQSKEGNEGSTLGECWGCFHSALHASSPPPCRKLECLLSHGSLSLWAPE